MSNPTSVEQLCNMALDRVGWPESIADIQDGAKASRVCLRLYGQTRDFLLAGGDWGFPRGDAVLTLLKRAPAAGYLPPVTPWDPAANPPQPYLFEYAYPIDALRIRRVRRQPIFIPNFSPTYASFQEANDNVPVVGGVAPGRVILCNIPDAVCVYVRQVIDMTQWDIGFVERMIAGIAERLPAALIEPTGAALQSQNLNQSIAAVTEGEAMNQQGR